MLLKIIKLFIILIPNKALRKKLRLKISTIIHGKQVLKTAKSIGEGLICLGNNEVTKNTVIGKHVRLNGVTCDGGGNINIGDHCVLASDVLILTSNHNYDKGLLIPYSDDPIINKDVIIEDFVWIGKRVTILPGTKIGEGAVIQAGAVVHGIIPPCAIIGGNPAKVFKYRDIEHFNKLKSEGKFLNEYKLINNSL